MTEGFPRGEHNRAEEELLPDHMREALRYNIELISVEEHNADVPLLESDRNLGSLLRHVTGRHQVEGYPNGPMAKSAVAHVERMIGVYLAEFGTEPAVANGEHEMRSSLPLEMSNIDAALLKAYECAEGGWQNLTPLWQAAYDDIHALFEADDELK